MDIWRAIGMHDHMENGHLPMGGGLMDQTQWFLDATRLISLESMAYRKHG